MRRLAAIADHPRLVWAACLLLTLAAAPGWWRLGFEEDIAKMFPPDFAEAQALMDYAEEFGGGDSLLLVIRGPHGRDALLAAGDACADALRRRLPAGCRVRHRMDRATQDFLQATFQDYAFCFLAPDELAGARARLAPAAVAAAVDRGVARLEATADPAAEDRFRSDPLALGADFFLPALRRSAGERLDLASGAMLAADGRALLLQVDGVEHARDVHYSRAVVAAAATAVADMRAALAAAGRPSDWQVTRAGGYLAAVVNERSIKGDMMLTTLTSVIGVLALFAVAFPPRWRAGPGTAGSPLGRLVAPHVLVLVPLLLGVGWTAGVTGWFVGDVTVITAGFISVLVGLSVDFPIHLLARYRDARGRRDGAAAVRAALRGTGPGLVAAALTTAGGFAVLGASRFRALAEMGLLTAVGLGCCLVAVLATAPALYPRVTLAERVPLRAAVARLGRWSPRGAVAVLVVTGVVTVVAVLGLATRGLGWQEDLRRLAAPNPEAQATQAVLADAFGLTADPLVLLTHAASADAAADEGARIGEALLPLQRAGHVALAFGPAVFCPSRERVAATASALADVDPDAVRAATTAALRAQGFEPADFAEAIDRVDRALRGSRRGDLTPARLAAHPDLWGRVVRAVDHGGVAATLVKPAAGVDRAAFAADVAAVVARVGPGTTVASVDRIVERLHAELVPEMTRLGGWAALAVALLALAHFRHGRWSAAALLPVALGLVWTGGCMAWLGLPLTFFNVCAGPLILGMGVDDGIHLVARHREPDRPGAGATLAAVGVPVVLTSLTTMLGFGSLALATSPGLRSLGVAAAIGVGACLAASLGPLTAILVLARPAGAVSPDEATPPSAPPG